MEITKDDAAKVTITGHIKTIEDYQKIRQAINSMVEQRITSLTINIPDSLSMTSSVIGYLLKVVHENNVAVNMNIKDERLFHLLDVLKLIAVFNVKKMS